MNKSELRTGMLLVDKEGNKSIVLLNTEHGDVELNSCDRNCGFLSNYKDDLKYCHESKYDIVKVYGSTTPVFSLYKDLEERTLLWERKELLTRKDISKLLSLCVDINSIIENSSERPTIYFSFEPVTVALSIQVYKNGASNSATADHSFRIYIDRLYSVDEYKHCVKILEEIKEGQS